MEIKFIESHSFLGEEMTMIVNGNHHRLEMNRMTYAQHAVKILKDIYDIDFKLEDVKFEWDGYL
jgi:phosphate starvation-inducible protein PhoH